MFILHILVSCMIFLSLLLNVIRMLMSTVSFLTKLEPGTIYFRMRSFNFMIKMSSNLELILWGVSN